MASDNVTGFTSYNGTTGSKWLEVLKETHQISLGSWQSFIPRRRSIKPSGIRSRMPRHGFGVEVMPGGVHNVEEIEQRISDFAIQENSGLILLPTP